MFEKLGALISLFRKGSEIANVELWKTGGVTVGALSAALLALVNFGAAFGIHIPISADQANGLATGIIALVGVVLPVITSKRCGILPAKPEQGGQPDASGDSVGLEAVPAASTAEPAAASNPGVPYVRHAANGDVLDGLDTTYNGA